MRYTFFFIITFFSSALFSQEVSGYLGKRLIVGYSTYFMPGLKGPGPFVSNSAAEASPTINNVHCLNVDFAHKQNKMISFSGQYMLTGVAYDNGKSNGTFFGDMFRSESYYPYPEGHRYVGDFSKPARLRSFNFSIGMKRYARGYIAPIGRYRKFEAILFCEKLTYDYQNFAIPDPNGNYEYDYIKDPLGTGEYKFKNIAFACTFGNQLALNDKIVLDYGIRFAYSPALNIITLAESDAYTRATGFFRRESNLRIAKQQLVNFHIGIGFLAY
mgnify:CR=1 FL=1